ncbi:MAG: hypothetical protein M0P09_01345 [Acholeplasmataceae bacterium]|nr:hypothetical protein [Acholeplasmataceae bacterium]
MNQNQIRAIQRDIGRLCDELGYHDLLDTFIQRADYGDPDSAPSQRHRQIRVLHHVLMMLESEDIEFTEEMIGNLELGLRIGMMDDMIYQGY